MVTDLRSSREQLSQAVRVISRCWLNEPDEELLQTLGDDSVGQALESLECKFPGFDLERPAAELLFEELAVEFCRLLIGPKGHVSPVESVWKEKRFQGTVVSEMQRYFELLPGYEPPPGMPDHIGVQLDFAAGLLTSDADDKTVADIRRQFAQQRLAWTSAFFDAVSTSTKNDYFSWLTKLSRLIVSELAN